MEKTHTSLLKVGKKEYEIKFNTITGLFGGAKTFDGRQTIYLEKAGGKVETIKTDFNADIPPTTREITLIEGVDGNNGGIYNMLYMLHSNDFMGYTSEYAKENGAFRMLKLSGYVGFVKRFSGLLTFLTTLLAFWWSTWAGEALLYGNVLGFITSLPYILMDTVYLVTNFFDLRYGSVWHGFVGGGVGYVISKLAYNLPVAKTKAAANAAFSAHIREVCTQIDRSMVASPADLGISASPEPTPASQDGFQPMM